MQTRVAEENIKEASCRGITRKDGLDVFSNNLEHLFYSPDKADWASAAAFFPDSNMPPKIAPILGEP